MPRIDVTFVRSRNADTTDSTTRTKQDGNLGEDINGNYLRRIQKHRLCSGLIDSMCFHAREIAKSRDPTRATALRDVT